MIWSYNSLSLQIILVVILFATTALGQEYVYYIFTPKCYSSLVQSLNLSDTQCLKLTLSKFLGYGIIVGGSIVKIPQVIKILANRSVYGISFTSILAQSMTNWVVIVYSWYRGNPFSIYGENVFILIQNIIILIMFIPFASNVPKQIEAPAKQTRNKYIVSLILFFVGLALTKDPNLWPSIIINYSLIVQISLFSFARLSQIIHIFKHKSTGHLAFVTAFLVILGNLGRLYTVLVEISKDKLFVLTIIIAVILNGTILAQFFIYWNKSTKASKQKSH